LNEFLVSSIQNSVYTRCPSHALSHKVTCGRVRAQRRRDQGRQRRGAVRGVSSTHKPGSRSSSFHIDPGAFQVEE
jgi:hypothetical protein